MNLNPNLNVNLFLSTSLDMFFITLIFHDRLGCLDDIVWQDHLLHHLSYTYPCDISINVACFVTNKYATVFCADVGNVSKLKYCHFAKASVFTIIS